LLLKALLHYVKDNSNRFFLTPFYSPPMRFAGTSAGTPTNQLALQRATSLNCSFAADAPIHAMMQPAESPLENED